MTLARTRDDALLALDQIDPVVLTRLVLVNDQVRETMETYRAQTSRRAEACYQIVAAGGSYADVARVIGVTSERVRQMVANHLGVDVGELNPQQKEPAANRH